MNNGAFWLSVVAIVMFGVLGGVLFKYGTEKFGAISMPRLLEVDISQGFWSGAGLMLIGIVCVLVGGWSLRGHTFAMNYLFSPLIFGALILMFLSRFLVGIPLSVTGLGRLTSITTSLLVLITAIASAVLFQERFNIRVVLGVLLSVLAVALLSAE